MKKFLLLMVMGIMGCNAAFAQWVTEPTSSVVITPDYYDLYECYSDMAPNGSVWTYFITPTGHDLYAVGHYVTLIDTLGNVVFDEPILISDSLSRPYTTITNGPLFVDRDGNAIVVVQDCRLEPDTLFRLSYTAYKISQEGEMLWGEEGILLDGERYDDMSSAITVTQITDGSYIFAWQSEHSYTDEKGEVIRMQRLSADGELLWNGDEVEIGDESGKVIYRWPTLIESGNNTAILVFFKGSSSEVTARKIDFEGQAAWSEDVTIYKSGFSNGMSAPLKDFSIEPSGDGGVVLAWCDDRYGTGSTAYMSYITAQGEHGFYSGVGGEQLSYNELLCTQAECKYDPVTDSFVAMFREAVSASYFSVVAQRVSRDGELLWGEECYEIYPLSPYQCANYSMRLGSDGEMGFFYTSNENSSNIRALATFVNTTNPEERRDVIFADSTGVVKTCLMPSYLYDNRFWIIEWLEAKPADLDFYKLNATRLNTDLTLGLPTSGVEAVCTEDATFEAVATWVDGEAAFAVNMPVATQATLAVYDTNGRLVAVPFEGELPATKKYISWNANVPAGIYMATLTTTRGVETVKIVVR